tara:strand:+ start:110 stop:484 length:375 start_codon:yes stop_codon:yes gene_type:complete
MNNTLGIEYAYTRIHKLEVEALAYKDKIAELEKQLTQVEDTFICYWVNFDAADIPLSMSNLLEFNALCARDASICREAAIQDLEQQQRVISSLNSYLIKRANEIGECLPMYLVDHIKEFKGGAE